MFEKTHLYSMQQFKNDATRFTEFRKELLLRLIPVFVLMFIMSIAIQLGNDAEINTASLMPVAISAIALGAGGYFSIKQQQTLYKSYLLTISEKEIARDQQKTPAIILPTDEITEIIKTHEGAFVIKRKSMFDAIIVSKYIERPDEVEATLAQIIPLTIRTQPEIWQKLMLPILLAAVCLVVDFYFTTNKILVAVIGTAMVAYMGYSFFAIRRNMNLDDRTRNSAYFVFLVILGIAGAMYYKLMAV